MDDITADIPAVIYEMSFIMDISVISNTAAQMHSVTSNITPPIKSEPKNVPM